MRRLGVEPDRAKDTLSRIAERVGRLKLNGRLLRRSPLSDLLELETLVVGITAKQALWASLREVPDIQIEELDQLFERKRNRNALSRTHVWQRPGEASSRLTRLRTAFECPRLAAFRTQCDEERGRRALAGVSPASEEGKTAASL